MKTRERFMFWLNMRRDDDLLIAEQIDELKATRQFTSAIRDGIRLICDLRQGRVGVLFELFPWLEIELQAQVATAPSVTPSNGSAGPVAMTVPTLAAPTFDDDPMPELVLKKDTSTASAANFLKSMAALNT